MFPPPTLEPKKTLWLYAKRSGPFRFLLSHKPLWLHRFSMLGGGENIHTGTVNRMAKSALFVDLQRLNQKVFLIETSTIFCDGSPLHFSFLKRFLVKTLRIWMISLKCLLLGKSPKSWVFLINSIKIESDRGLCLEKCPLLGKMTSKRFRPSLFPQQ